MNTYPFCYPCAVNKLSFRESRAGRILGYVHARVSCERASVLLVSPAQQVPDRKLARMLLFWELAEYFEKKNRFLISMRSQRPDGRRGTPYNINTFYAGVSF